MNPMLLRSILAIAVAVAAGGASAHAGADAGLHHGLLSGLAHPLTGLDHLAAMLAVGCAGARGSRPWLAPVAFAAALLAGALATIAGFAPVAVEPMIAASLLVLGLLVAVRARLGNAAIAAIGAAFAVFHGAAHATELGAGGAAALAGMTAASLALLAAGAGLGRLLPHRAAPWVRLAGAATAACGIAQLATTLAR